jgi:uncharacterized repeat protein (TIGR02543 family)
MPKRFAYLFIVVCCVLSFLLTLVPPTFAQEWQDLASDLDGDGLLNDLETAGWHNGAGGPFVTDPLDADSDDDGLTDGEEKLYDTIPVNGSGDLDGSKSPGIYVRYEGSLYTSEYFRVADPDYLSMKQAGSKCLMTEAMVVRRGTTFHIGGYADASIAIDGNGYTTLIPTVGDYDLYEGGWTVSVPGSGRVGIFTATMSFDGWQASMPIYVIFEIPPTTSSPILSQNLTQAHLDAFLYNDDPADQRDEVGVIYRTWIEPYEQDGYTQRRASGFAQAFWTEHYERFVFLDLVMPTIHGKTTQASATDALSSRADDEVRVNWRLWDYYKPTNMATTLYRYVDPEDPEGRETQTGTACHAQAGVFTGFLRSAGIPATPWITDHMLSQYDTSVMVWFEYQGTPQWMSARSYLVEETDDEYKYYPFTGGDANYRLLREWTYSESNENVLVVIDENWDFEQWVPKEGDTCPNYFEAGDGKEECYVEGTVSTKWLPDPYMKTFSREYKWDSFKSLEWVELNPLINSLILHNWTDRDWVPTDPPWGYTYYDLPTPYPGGDVSENWPTDPVPQTCPPGITVSAGCPYPNTIGNLVWSDLDGDGYRDGGEPGIGGAVVTMTLVSPSTVYTDITSSGVYGFDGLPIGTYILTVDSSTLPPGAVLTTDNDPLTVTIASDEDSYTDADFGFQIPGGMAAASVTPVGTNVPSAPEIQPALAQPPNLISQPFIAGPSTAPSSPVQFGPVLNDFGIDTNDNGRFDALIVEVEVTASRAGDHTLGGMLALPGGITPYGGLYAEDVRTHLHAGTQTVQLSFDGLAIGNAEARGPYQVADLWVTDVEDFDFHLGPWDVLLDYQHPDYTTAPYSVQQFETLPAKLADLYEHYGIDEDGDGRYESVAIDVALDVAQEGRYQVEGDLYDSAGSFVGHATWNGSGTTASLLFGLERTRPPYTLEQLQLFEHSARGRLLDSRHYDAYTIDDLEALLDRDAITLGAHAPILEPGAIRPMGEHITPTQVFDDRVVDLDGDGLYDQLVVDVEVEVSQAGEYRVEGWLEAPDGSPVVYGVSEPVSLSVGSQMTLSLPFDGRAINGHGVVSGAYTVIALRILDGNENSHNVLDQVNRTGLALDYSAQHFEPASLVDTVFSDDMESGSANWTWDNPPWSYTSVSWPWPTTNWKAASSSHSGSLALTGLDLSEHNAPVLGFDATFDFSSPGDVGYVEASDDGLSWTKVATYTDALNRWATEFVALSDFGETPNLHLRFNADAENGLLWTVDDVTVYAESLQAEVSFIHLPQPALAGEATTFIASYSFPTPTPPVTLTWDFGDGSPIQVTNAATTTHQYPQALDYTVIVTAENDYDSATAEKTIEVHALLNVNVVGSGTVSKAPDQPTYRDGDVVTLDANASTGWSFVNWSGDLSGTTNPQSITISDSKEVTATFTLDEYTLTVDTAGNGTVSKSPDQATYHYGDVVQLTANADPGWSFSHWSGDLTGSDNPGSLTITGDANVTATFTQDEYTLTVDTSGNGGVARSPDQATYHYGDVVELTALPATGWQFSGWSGDLSGSDNPGSLTITGDTNVTATFVPIEYTLTVNVTGNGTVSKNPDQATYHYGDVVQLTAVPATGWQFAGWSGDLNGGNNPGSLTITGDTNVTATFIPIEYTLTVNVTGNGTVSRNPDQTTYHYGDVVQLTANADPGWSLSHWSGDLTGSDNPRSLTITGDMNVTATFTEDEYTLTVNTNGGGGVTRSPDQSTYHYGDIVELSAVPATGWQFADWSGDLSGSTSPQSITMTGDKNVTATFVPIEYTLTVNVTGSGTVSKNPNQTTYHYGDVVELTANADPGWSFSHWSGDLSGSDNPGSLTITGDTAVTATFVPIEYTLTVNVTGDGTVSKNPDQATYHYGDVVQLTANADPGWSLSHWSGDLTGSDNPGSLTITGDANVTATFTQDEYALTVNTSGSGSVTKDPDQTTYHFGDTVELTATPATGWSFAGWGGDLSGSDNPGSLTITGDTSITATFTQDEYTLSIDTVGGGSVTRDPDQTTYHYGDVVQLTAEPNTHWSFSEWSGDLSGSANPQSITMTGDKSVTASFTPDGYLLTISTDGDGSVSRDPDRDVFFHGEMVTLTATPAPGWTFTGWSGDLSGSAAVKTLTIDSDKNITATFVPIEYTLTVNVTGDGTVSKNPDQATYHYGDVVELTADADPGWDFSHWSGDLSGSDNPKSITMDSDKAVTANFSQIEYDLTVIIVGDGSVTKNPDQATYHYGDTVALTANPALGWSFAGWSGDLSGTTNPESIAMSDRRTVTATFTRDEYTLAVDTAGNGSVTKDPDQATYTHGDIVELTATADPGWTFVNWTGDLSSTSNPESITITGNKAITANFSQDEYTLAIAVVGSGSVLQDPEQISYHYGDVVELTAVPATGWQFAGWSGDLNGDTSPQSITITGAKNVTATFTAQPLTEIGFTASPDAPVARAVVTFTAVITPAYATQPVTYTWGFSDGGDLVVTTVPQVIHTFAASGRYTVSLTATNGYGPPCTHSAQIVVAAQSEPSRRLFLPLVARG